MGNEFKCKVCGVTTNNSNPSAREQGKCLDCYLATNDKETVAQHGMDRLARAMRYISR
jgi:hypothetical protein